MESKVGRSGGEHIVHSHPERAHYDIDTAMAILDAGRFGHLATVFEPNIPHLVPMMYMRRGRSVHLHGRRGTRLIEHLSRGAPLAFSVTLVDGLVLARNARFHSLNYRSLVIHGVATVIDDMDAKRASLTALANRSWPGRAGISPPTLEQLASITLLALPLECFSAKVRTGPPAPPLPGDDRNVWAGHVDLRTAPSAFYADEFTPRDLSPPSWPFGE